MRSHRSFSLILADAANVYAGRGNQWWRNRDAAAQRLVDQTSHWTQRHRVSCTVVFDPLHRKRPPTGTHDVDIVISRHRGRNAADRTILDIARNASEPSSICVYTSDRYLANALKPLGVTVRSAGTFRCQFDEATNPFRCPTCMEYNCPMASTTPDVHDALVKAGIDRPAADELMRRLHRRPGLSTTSLPLGVFIGGFGLIASGIGWVKSDIHAVDAAVQALRTEISANRNRIDIVNDRVSSLETSMPERMARIETLLNERLPARQ